MFRRFGCNLMTRRCCFFSHPRILNDLRVLIPKIEALNLADAKTGCQRTPNSIGQGGESAEQRVAQRTFLHIGAVVCLLDQNKISIWILISSLWRLGKKKLHVARSRSEAMTEGSCLWETRWLNSCCSVAWQGEHF